MEIIIGITAVFALLLCIHGCIEPIASEGNTTISVKLGPPLAIICIIYDLNNPISTGGLGVFLILLLLILIIRWIYEVSS